VRPHAPTACALLTREAAGFAVFLRRHEKDAPGEGRDESKENLCDAACVHEDLSLLERDPTVVAESCGHASTDSLGIFAAAEPGIGAELEAPAWPRPDAEARRSRASSTNGAEG